MPLRFPRRRRFRINILEPVHECDIFGTQCFFQFFHFLRQLIDRFAVFFLVGLLEFVTKFANSAIGLALSLVAADNFDDLLRVRPD